jgi:two-component system, NtrC family, nitrogen regulation sensor histidine kinase NtrY
MRISVEGRLAALLLGAMLWGALVALAAFLWTGSLLASTLLTLLIGVLPVLWCARRVLAPIRRLLRSMTGAVASYRDGDFSLSLAVDRDDELGELLRAHNELGHALREQRQHLAQRELLLDTVTQHSPLAILLSDAHQRVVYANIAARHLLNQGASMQGADLNAALESVPPALRDAITASTDSLASVKMEQGEEVFHVARQMIKLRGRPHRLLLVKRLTRELSRQEVAIWKKLIRVLSHELNNSLAPIGSLANTGIELARREDYAPIAGLLQTIRGRASHLGDFIASYAEFARLPAPRPERTAWNELIGELRNQSEFQLVGELPELPGFFDRAQLEQALINLLRNAKESGSAPEHIELSVEQGAREQIIEVRDRGSGMSDTVLAQALLPFYSTKRSGTGLGLALAREITEAHGGRIRLANREAGGVIVALHLPVASEQ